MAAAGLMMKPVLGRSVRVAKLLSDGYGRTRGCCLGIKKRKKRRRNAVLLSVSVCSTMFVSVRFGFSLRCDSTS